MTQPPSDQLSLRDVGDDEWDDILDETPTASPYHTAAFLRTVSISLERPLRLLAARVNGKDVGGVPLLIRRRGPLASINWDPVIPLVGPVVPARWQLETMSLASRFSGGFTMLELHESVMQCPENPPGRWSLEPLDTYLLNIADKSEKDLLSQMSQSARRHVRRASSLTVDVATPWELVECLPEWTAAAYSRNGDEQVYPKTFTADVFAAVKDRWPHHAGAIRVDGRPVCIWFVLARGDRAYFWQMAVDPADRALPAAYGAYWQMIQWAQQQGCRSLDLGLAPTPGLSFVKVAVGGVARPVFRYRRESIPARAVRNTQASASALQERIAGALTARRARPVSSTDQEAAVSDK